MPVYPEFGVGPQYCPGGCGQPAYDTGCDALGCDGLTCIACGAGCDIEFAAGGKCDSAIPTESDAERDARYDRLHAFFGLPPRD